MGTFHTPIEVAATAEGPFVDVDALVDSGSRYTLLPRSFLVRLGVAPTDTPAFILADGRRIERPIGEAVIRIEGRVRTNVVVFGESETESLLGAFTLESFGLGIDLVNGVLIPVAGYLMPVDREGTP